MNSNIAVLTFLCLVSVVLAQDGTRNSTYSATITQPINAKNFFAVTPSVTSRSFQVTTSCTQTCTALLIDSMSYAAFKLGTPYTPREKSLIAPGEKRTFTVSGNDAPNVLLIVQNDNMVIITATVFLQETSVIAPTTPLFTTARIVTLAVVLAFVIGVAIFAAVVFLTYGAKRGPKESYERFIDTDTRH